MQNRVIMRQAAVFMVIGLGIMESSAQTTFVPEAGEFNLAGSLPGEQLQPSLALGDSWGLAVWQDNATDGDGFGISAVRLDGNFSPVLSPLRVNSGGAGNQEYPAVSLLASGGAAVVWQGGPQGREQIYARFMAADYTWTGADILVNDLTGDVNTRPDVAGRLNGSVIVTWSRYDESGRNGYDVYARRLSSVGSQIGAEFRVNTTTNLHQQNSKIAVLSGGGTSVVVWVSQGQRSAGSSDIYARKFSLQGTPLTGEILVNSSLNRCDNPSVTATEGGGFAVAWQEKTGTASSTDGLDILTRAFDSAGVGGQIHRANSQVYGDQYEPQISSQGPDMFVVWTSLGQDGSREGVYGRFLNSAAAPVGSEFRVNSTTGGGQKHPTVASGASNRWVAAWSSYVGGINTIDLKAQRYAPFAEPLLAPDAPFVSPASTTSLSVTWPALEGFEVASYELYVDGSSSPAVITTNSWSSLTNLLANRSYSVRLGFSLTDGRTSPLSAPTTGITYGQYGTYLWLDLIPADWMALHYGNTPWLWTQNLGLDADGDGASLYNEFLAGTDPRDPASVLKMQLAKTSQGLFLSWNTVPGQVYQLQTSAAGSTWTNSGSPRFAAEEIDSTLVGSAATGFYRILRVR